MHFIVHALDKTDALERRMASIAVDTAGAGSLGHRIDIPFLDVDVAQAILERLYHETRTTEFRW
jgi:hypothetical protein